ncbi:MAG: 30S ribosomal protein S6e [Candidatus Woesearchaeota archaeon]
MVEFKLSIADPKNKKTYKKNAKDKEATVFLGKKIGEIVELPGFSGYKFQITGGSDYAGFPMRAEISGPVRKRIYSEKGVGFRIKEKGKKLRKTVCGNTIHPKIVQINLKIIEYGTKPLEEQKEEKQAKEK